MVLVEGAWDDARAAVAGAARALPAVRMPIARCDGLVLAVAMVAGTALPAFDTSAMDGWAVSGRGPWRIVGASLAGRPWRAPLSPGSAVVIATGAVVPEGADAVVRSEDGAVRAPGPGGPGDPGGLLRAADPGGPTHIRPAGEECARGDVLVGAGAEVTPAIIGLAAASGHDDLEVIPRPRAALALFGDELAHAGRPGGGMVRDSLGPQVPAWLARMGVDVVSVGTAEDSLAAHVHQIARGARAADVVLTTGGTAAGPVDHLHEAIREGGGALVVDRVAVRPGHPMLAATLAGGSTWLLGLPGNPLSAIVSLMSLGAPVLDVLAGRQPSPLGSVVLADALGAPARETRLVPGTIDGGRFRAAAHLGSGMLRGLAHSTGFAVVPPGGAPAGATVRWSALPDRRTTGSAGAP